MVVSLVEPLPERYHKLFERAKQLLEDDERVRAMWLTGSLGRGTADAASDLDVAVTVSDEHHDAFAKSWRDWLGDITPTVLAEELPFAPGSFYSVTPGFERFDVLVERVSAVPQVFDPARVVVFDRDGLAELLPPPFAGLPPSSDTVSGLIQEFFRISAIETVIVRDDWLLGREHLHALSSLIYRLFVEANAPLPLMGLKQWSTKLTPAQRQTIAQLPTNARNVDELRTAHLAHSSAFVANAEVLAARLSVSWPNELEQAATAHLKTTLGLQSPYPRTEDIVLE